MGFPTKNILKERIKTFLDQFYYSNEYNEDINHFKENFSDGLANILWELVYDSKVQSNIDVMVSAGIPVSVNTQTGIGTTMAAGSGATVELGTIIPPTS